MADALSVDPPVPDSMQTRMLPIAQVRRYWKNPRRKQNVDKLAALIRRYGWRQPLVVDQAHVIVAGDSRYLAAEANAETHVPVWVAADLSESEAIAYRLADNRIAEESEWDENLLKAELQLLQSIGIGALDELADATAFDPDELERLLSDAGEGTLEPVPIAQFPPHTWVLIGIPTGQYPAIAEHVEAITLVPEAFVEVTANDTAAPQRKKR
jgi:site-specific DNA-methyltransferase (adenine-specific)